MNTCNKPSLSPITQETKNVNVDLKLTTRIAALRNGKRKEKSKWNIDLFRFSIHFIRVIE